MARGMPCPSCCFPDRRTPTNGGFACDRVAQELALAHPDTVHRLVLACTSLGGAAAQERDDDVKRSLIDLDPQRRLHALVDLFYTPAFVRRCGGYDRVPRHLFGDPAMYRRGAHRHLLASAAHDASARLHLIRVPTLILHGADDRMAPVANATVLAECIPAAASGSCRGTGTGSMTSSPHR